MSSGTDENARRPLTDTILPAEKLPVLPPQPTVLVAVHISIRIDSRDNRERECLQCE